MATEDDTPTVTILADHEHADPAQLIYGIQGIARTLEGDMYNDIENETVQLLIDGLKTLADQLYRAVHTVPHDLENRIKRAIEAPEAEEHELARQLPPDYQLVRYVLTDAYAVVGRDGNLPVSLASLDTVRGWFEGPMREAG